MENFKIQASTVQTNNKVVFPNLSQSWGLFGVFLIASLIIAVVIMAVTILMTELNLLDDSLDIVAWLGLSAFIGIFAITFAFAYFYSKSRGSQIHISKRLAPWWVYLLLLPLTPSMAILVDSIVNLIPMPEYFKKMFESMVSLNVPSFITAVIAAPILEEILCRGIIFEGLLNYERPHRAILWSALIFAALHLNPWQGIAAFSIGYVSAWIYRKTRSLGPSIFIHFLNNGMAFGLLYILGDPGLKLSDIFGEYYIHALLLSVLVFGICGFFLYKLLDNKSVSLQ